MKQPISAPEGHRAGGAEGPADAAVEPAVQPHKSIRSFTATPRDLAMLEAISRYHGFSRSATMTSLVRKEFWRVFPGGTGEIRPDPGARVVGKEFGDENTDGEKK